MSSVDPRLAHLPDDLRAVAEEFLTLHEAWDTSWKASIMCTDTLVMEWEDEDFYVRMEWYFRSWFHGGYTGHGWNLRWARKPDPEVESVRMGVQGDLRRSHDFAEFVRRFKL